MDLDHPPVSVSLNAFKMSLILSVKSSSQASLIAVSVASLFLSIIAVLSRLMARRVANRKLDGSDYCSVAGCVSFSPAVSNDIQACIADEPCVDMCDRILDMLSHGRVQASRGPRS